MDLNYVKAKAFIRLPKGAMMVEVGWQSPKLDVMTVDLDFHGVTLHGSNSNFITYMAKLLDQ